MKRYHEYVRDVKKGNVLACENLRRAVARFERDMKEAKAKRSPWVFDEDEADRIIDFMECLVQWEEPFAGEPLVLQNWQCFFFGQLYGWRHRETGKRRFKKALKFVAKKQGKTTEVAGIALYEMLTKAGIQVYSLATKSDIAYITYNILKAFIEQDDELPEVFSVLAHSIINVENRSKFQALSSDNKVDGKNTAVAIIDELASHDNAEAYHALISGMGTRSEALTVIITTAGYGLDNPMIEEYAYATDILEGNIKDDSYLVAIYEYDKNDKWDDLSKLQKSCPSLNVTVAAEYFETQVLQARRVPSLAAEYKVKYCNTWEAKTTTWITDHAWMKGVKAAAKAAVPEEELSGAPCIIALDFSTIWDWTAATRYYYLADRDRYVARHRFYIPEAQVDTKIHLENPSIRAWIEAGLLVATPGAAIDYAYVFRDLDADLMASDVLGVTYDPAKAKEVEMQYASRITILPFVQKTANMSPAAKAWEKAVIDGHIYDESPILRWMVSNTMNKVHPDSGSYFITKSATAKGRRRIDGVITSLMAYSVLRDQIQERANRPKIFDLSQINY